MFFWNSTILKLSKPDDLNLQDGLPQLETTLHCKDEIDISGKHLSIIEAIEEKNLTGRISFCARIQRVFCKYMKREETGCRTFQIQIGCNNEFELRYQIVHQLTKALNLLIQYYYQFYQPILIQCSPSQKNQSFDLHGRSIDWFLCDCVHWP